MKDLTFQPFDHPKFGRITSAVNANGTTLFLANDVARALGYSKYKDAVTKHCKHVQILETPMPNQHGAIVMQKARYIPESDIYRLVMRSKLPHAKRFQDWVVEEVLPCIRAHGAYMSDVVCNQLLDDPDEIIRQAMMWKDRIRAERHNDSPGRLL